MFEYNNKEFLNKLDKYITNVNARALNLHHFDYNIAEAALNTYKLTEFVFSCLFMVHLMLVKYEKKLFVFV